MANLAIYMRYFALVHCYDIEKSGEFSEVMINSCIHNLNRKYRNCSYGGVIPISIKI